MTFLGNKSGSGWGCLASQPSKADEIVPLFAEPSEKRPCREETASPVSRERRRGRAAVRVLCANGDGVARALSTFSLSHRTARIDGGLFVDL